MRYYLFKIMWRDGTEARLQVDHLNLADRLLPILNEDRRVAAVRLFEVGVVNREVDITAGKVTKTDA